MRLVEESVPASRREAKYAAYVPLVQNFNDSHMCSARVVLEADDRDTPDKVPGRLKCAISSLRLDGSIEVRTRAGNTYLTRRR